jgi:hypothetical protein
LSAWLSRIEEDVAETSSEVRLIRQDTVTKEYLGLKLDPVNDKLASLTNGTIRDLRDRIGVLETRSAALVAKLEAK